jgi:hypothetical protein
MLDPIRNAFAKADGVKASLFSISAGINFVPLSQIFLYFLKIRINPLLF